MKHLKKMSEIKSEILIYFCPLIVEDQERKFSNAKKIKKNHILII